MLQMEGIPWLNIEPLNSRAEDGMKMDVRMHDRRNEAAYTIITEN